MKGASIFSFTFDVARKRINCYENNIIVSWSLLTTWSTTRNYYAALLTISEIIYAGLCESNWLPFENQVIYICYLQIIKGLHFLLRLLKTKEDTLIFYESHNTDTHACVNKQTSPCMSPEIALISSISPTIDSC